MGPKLCWWTCALVALCVSAVAAQEAEWAGDRYAFSLQGGRLQTLCVAPEAGALTGNTIRDGGFGGIRPGEGYAAEVLADGVRATGLIAFSADEIESPQATTPILLEPGATIGRTFSVHGGTLERAALRTPTWNTTDSTATLRLRRGGPEGELIAERRPTAIEDNAWTDLAFDPQPAGDYYLELSDVSGMVGVWAVDGGDDLKGGLMWNGVPAEGPVPQVRFWRERLFGPAEVSYRAVGASLVAELRVSPLEGQSPIGFPLQLLYPWDKWGYGLSPEKLPFASFHSDAMRYMPSEQLQRWVERDGWYELSLDGREWIEADGLGTYDLRFSAARPNLRWQLRGEETLLELSTATSVEEGQWVVRWTLDASPRDGAVPDDWPRFELPDPAQAAEANRFLYERDFSYPPLWGPSAWFDWNALGRMWQNGGHLDQLGAHYEGTPITEEGYVHTWGGLYVGWPFPGGDYDTRHFDSNARWILGCWRYGLWRGDTDFLLRQASRLRLAMRYQLETLGGASSALIRTASKDVTGRHRGVGDNYWDILPFGGLDAYTNAVWYASLEAMAQIEEMLARRGDAGSAPVSPADLRALAARARTAYTETFWDEEKGRFIGCIDEDGVRHDYGFTFVNLEAMAYGLASPEQAQRIYRWMETEPTSSGEADTYSAWAFAPRATTLHNPTWDPATGESLEPDCPQQPWWMFGWIGTAFGDQCQDGGAILYTSYFDLMARLRLVSPDNAWQRWEAILERWREPDHLCGGPPLYRGEHPQQINPGSTGTDIPFPESGLVPCWLLNGVLGVEPTPAGLRIAPRLPEGLEWAGIRNLGWRGMTLDVRVTRRAAQVSGVSDGRPFRWTRALGADGSVLFSAP